MNKYELFKEISSINQEIRKSIYHSMPKQYRIDIGVEILQCMRHLKLLAYYLSYNVISEDDFKVEFSKELVHLKMLIDESIEDKILLLSGPFTIILPRKRLMNLCKEFNIMEDMQQQPSSMKG